MSQRPTVFGSNFSAFRFSHTNPSQLQEINLDNEFSMACHSPTKASPNHIRTMKDYEEQLSSLRKENFNLKLKVYFLEERLDNKPYVNSSQGDLFKKNIELEVKLEGLKKEITEQQELICEAAKALEALEASAASKENELNLQIASLQEELNILKENANGKTEKIEDSSINPDLNGASGVTGADDSVALYTAAFNIPRPAPSENLQRKIFKPNNCECQKLRTLLNTERETASTLRNLVSSRDKDILHNQQKLQELYEKVKLLESEKAQFVERNDEIEVNSDKEQVDKLKQENINACQMIQNCLVRIKQVERENKKLKQNLTEKENVDQSQEKYLNNNQTTLIQKYTDMLDERDNRILELENELKSKNVSRDDKEWSWMNNHLKNKIDTLRESIYMRNEKIDETSDIKDNNQKNLLNVLTSRLQEMAYFLDSLLSNRCIIGEEKCRKVENLLEQSLELPIGLKLDPSASQLLEDSYADLTLNNMSQSLKLTDLTKLFGHHVALDDTLGPNKPIEYKNFNDLNKNKEYAMLDMQLQIKNEEIEQLKAQLKYQNDSCICKSIEDTDSKTELDLLKPSPFEYNKLLLKKPKSKSGKFTKYNPNVTWHGQEVQVDQSESECWSEPDRSVSLARMGGPLEVKVKDYVSSEEETCACRKHPYSTRQTQSYTDDSKFSQYYGQMRVIMEEKMEIQKMLEEANIKILSLENCLETNKHQYILNLNQNLDEINKLNKKLKNAEDALEKYIQKHKDMTEQLTAVEQRAIDLEDQLREVEKSLAGEQQQHESIQKRLQNELKEMSVSCDVKIKEMKDKMETDWVSRVRYDALRKELDNAVLQASQATLDRNLATEQKTRSDAEADRLRKSLTDTKLKVNELESRFVHLNTWQNQPNNMLVFPAHESNSPQRATSPDQGIDSDRLSSLELIEPVSAHDDYTAPDLSAENAALRKKLEWTKRMLEDTQKQLNTINYRKKKEQRAMCQEIHKTQSVLRQVRDNLTHDS